MTITLGELITKIRDARGKMSTANANKLLFGQCEAVLMELADKLYHAQHATNPDPPQIVIP